MAKLDDRDTGRSGAGAAAIRALAQQNGARPELAAFLQEIARRHPERSRLLFVCIGTDRSTGDAFGPMVGTLLHNAGFGHVIGTLDNCCDADSIGGIANKVGDMRETGMTVVAIDACLGKPKSVGGYLLAEGPLQPAAATGRKLAPIGDYSIAGVVNESGIKGYWKLQTTSLNLVLLMAQEVAGAIDAAWKQAAGAE